MGYLHLDQIHPTGQSPKYLVSIYILQGTVSCSQQARQAELLPFGKLDAAHPKTELEHFS